MADIFVSYSRRDRAFTNEFVKKLNRSFFLYEIFYDRNIERGDQFWKTILNEIEDCSVFILLISDASLKSEYCIKELKEALILEKRIFPVFVRDDADLDCLNNHFVEIQDTKTTLRKQIDERNWTHLESGITENHAEYKALIQSIRPYLPKPHLTKPIIGFLLSTTVCAIIVYWLILSVDYKVIANFDSCNNINNLGDAMGVALSDGSDLSMTFERIISETCSVKLKYAITDWAALWIRMNDLDMGPYRAIQLDIRAETLDSQHIKLELKRADELSIFRINDITTDWSTKSIPLVDFRSDGFNPELTGFDHMQELVFTIERPYTNETGVIYIDNIRLVK